MLAFTVIVLVPPFTKIGVKAAVAVSGFLTPTLVLALVVIYPLEAVQVTLPPDDPSGIRVMLVPVEEPDTVQPLGYDQE